MQEQGRFQKAKYLRQLYRMRSEWRVWRGCYHLAATEHQDDWLGSRFQERFEAVDDLLHHLEPLQERLERLT